MKKSEPSSFTVSVHPGKYIVETSPSIGISLNKIKEFDPENLSIPCYPGMTEKDFKLALKLTRVSKGCKLGDYSPSRQGEVNLTSHLKFISDHPKGKIVLRGANIGRYEFIEEPRQGTPKFLDVKKFISVHGKNTKFWDHRYVRIGYQRGAAIDNWRRIIATRIEPENFCSDTINYIVNPKLLNLYAILAFLSSSLWEWRFRLSSTTNHINSYEIDNMPITCFSFSTPEKEKREVLNSLKEKYFDAQFDQLLKEVDTYIPKDINYNFIPKKECPELVHDFLAFFAEQIIKLNEQKKKEIKSFINWLEFKIKTKIEDLKGKTIIKEYYRYELGELITRLENNNVIVTRGFQKLFENEFNKSLKKIKPLIQITNSTDNLIDQIIYKLYYLTEEEIKIVERTAKNN